MPETNEKKRERYWRNRERELERKRRYTAANLEKVRAADQERRRREKEARGATPEERRARGNALRKAAWAAKRAAKAAADPEAKERARLRGLAHSRAWRAANRDRQRELMREWAKTPKGRASKQGRKIRRRAVLVLALTKLQRGRCAYCREKLAPARTHIDHIHPRAKGGPNARRNYQLACADCNISKSAKDPIVYAQEIGLLL